MSDRSIREAVQWLAGTKLSDNVYSLEATVKSVDEGARTCVCQIVSGKVNNILDGVQLMAGVDDGFLIIPAVGSNVKIIKSDFTDAYIAQYSEVDKIIFRGGDLGGLVKVISNVQRLNLIENKINSLLAAYNGHVHVANNTATVSLVAGTLTPTQRSDIENTKITQG
jgi:hypothetical protein